MGAIDNLVRQHKAKFEEYMESYIHKVDKSLASLDLNDVVKPEIKEGLLDIPKDISMLTDIEVGQKHFAAVQQFGYISCSAARAGVEVVAAEEAKDGAFSDAILKSDGKSADDRKAEAERDPIYRAWNNIWMEKKALCDRLKVLANSWDRRAESYSREMTVRMKMLDKGV